VGACLDSTAYFYICLEPNRDANIVSGRTESQSPLVWLAFRLVFSNPALIGLLALFAAPLAAFVITNEPLNLES